MNRKAVLLNTLRKLQERLESAHDLSNDKFGPAHQMTQTLMMCYAMAFGAVCDAESILDEENQSSDD